MAKIKLRLAVIAIFAILVTLLGQNTVAYYTTIGKATNVITSGIITITGNVSNNAKVITKISNKKIHLLF